MGHFRIRKTLNFGRLLRFNFSKTGTSASIGSHGATVNIGRKGIFATLGIPGSGVSYREKLRTAHRPFLLLTALVLLVAVIVLTVVPLAVFLHQYLGPR